MEAKFKTPTPSPAKKQFLGLPTKPPKVPESSRDGAWGGGGGGLLGISSGGDDRMKAKFKTPPPPPQKKKKNP